MRDPKTIPKIPLFLRLSKSLTYLCFSVILFSTSAVTWAQELEGSIPNENGDYCVIMTFPPVLPKGGTEYLELNMWSSTKVTSADVNGQIVRLDSSSLNDSSYKTDVSFGKDVQQTTPYTLTVVPKVGSEYSCSTSVTVLDNFGTVPKEDSCSLTAIPLQRRSEDEIYMRLSLSWEKFEDNAYVANNSVLIGDRDEYRDEGHIHNNISRCFSDSVCNYDRTYLLYPKIADFPVTYTAKVYWQKKNEDGRSSESYDVVSRCSVTVEGLLPEKLPPSPQPVQPTKLTYNDGLQAGKQQCIDEPAVCGIDSNSSSGFGGIELSDGVAIFDTITNMLTIPAIEVSLIDAEGFEYTERFEAQMQATSPTDLTQFSVTGLEPVNPQLPDILPDHPALGIGEDFVKEYLTLNQQTKAVKVLKALRTADKLMELLNGLDRHRDNPVKQALYGLEFILRHSKYVSFGVLIEEDALVRTYDAINGRLSAAVRIAGVTETFGIRVMKEKWGWIPDKAISDVDITIHQITKYQTEQQNYCVFYELQELSGTEKPQFQCQGNPETFQGEYGSWAYGYSFKRSNGLGIPTGLYLVEVSKDGEVLKVDTVFINSDNQTLAIYLE